jgi:hypothetical protein
MKALILLALSIIPAGAALAAINPKYQFEAQNKAPEVLKVRIVETKLVPKARIPCAERFRDRLQQGDSVRSEFTAQLKVLETLRSATGVKPGAVITIAYEVEVHDKTCRPWPGPAPSVPLKKGAVLYALLSTVEKTAQGLAARGSSFRDTRPDLKPKQ